MPVGETGFDQLLGFTVPVHDARGRVVRLGPVLEQVLAAHNYPPVIRDLLAEALVLVALVGGLLKDANGQLTMQAHTDGGAVELLVCDYRGGELRGYARHDAERLAGLGPHPSLFALFGRGYLAITFDLASTGQRYQGIVPLEGDSLAEACQAYFRQSEQVPTLIRVGLRCSDNACSAGGVLVQHLPEGEDGRERLHTRMDHPAWEHVAALAGSVRAHELSDPMLSLEAMVWRLFHAEPEVRIDPGPRLTRGCRCTEAYYRTVLARFPASELAEMRDETGRIVIDCAFCSRLFPIAM